MKKFINALTISRMAMGIIVIMLSETLSLNSFLFFAILLTVIAIASDIIDGALAKKLFLSDETGSFLDKISDNFYWVCLITAVSVSKLFIIPGLTLILRDTISIFFKRSDYINYRIKNLYFLPENTIIKLLCILQVLYLFIHHNYPEMNLDSFYLIIVTLFSMSLTIHLLFLVNIFILYCRK